ncbi:MAG: FAD-binding oxidoreductase [Pseudomonadota bacterium]
MNRSTAARQASRTHYDVIIVGGAKIGSAIAWFLSANADFDGSVLVVEKDPSYEFSSTAHTNSCMRQQFSNELNIRISQFAAEFVKNFADYLGENADAPDIHFQSFGYLYLAADELKARSLREAQALQNSCGAATHILTSEEIASAYPFYNVQDIVLGSHNLVDEGYYDGNTVFDWWRRRAQSQGVEYVDNEIVTISKNRARDTITSVTLRSGDVIACGKLVNATGPRASRTAMMAGLDIPVEPRKRYTYVFSAERPLAQDLPLTIDPSGVHVRSDGSNYLAGCAPQVDVAVEPDDFVADHSLWQEKVWPALAHRIPRFDALKLINSWVGHYAYNTLDQNAILGPHTQVSNFLFANGFSGHGFQQAPAVGRGISEWITYGEYRSLDLSALGYERIKKEEPFLEKAVI